MAEISPFRGLRFATHRDDPTVYAPPYDVISPAERAVLLDRNPLNVVRLDLGPTPADPGWYGEAATILSNWLARGVLQRDATPAFYGYRQQFIWGGKQYTRTGFLARVHLTQWGQGIYRHELTRNQPKADRLQLMRALDMQTSPVFGLFTDASGEATDVLSRVPHTDTLNLAMADGVSHLLWRIDEPAEIQVLRRGLAASDIVIADGHHRYETALALATERHAQCGSSAADDVLMCLVPKEDPGLLILPTHRIVRSARLTGDALLRALSQRMAVSPCNRPLTEAIRGQDRTFGLRLPGSSHVLSVAPSVSTVATCAPVAALDGLDVSLLQTTIMEPILGITPDQLADSDVISYTIDEAEACRRVDAGEAELALILNPTPLSAVWHTALRGQVMPQKSTFFYPKLLTGLVMNPLWD